MAPLIAAGKLRRRIELQAMTGGQDAAGQPVQTWATVATLWSQPAGDNGMRTMRNAADGIGAETKRYSFRIRYREGLNENMRVVSNGVAYDIRAVRMDLADKVWTDLVCEEHGDGSQ